MIRRERFRVQVLLRVAAGTFLLAVTTVVSAGVADARAYTAPVFDRQPVGIGYSSGFGTGAADLDQDGLNDLLVCGYGATRFYPGNGDGTFDRLDGSEIRGECLGLRVANMDGDVYPDVVVGEPYGTPAVRILEYDPSGGLAIREELLVEHSLSGVRVADIDGDGAEDVIAFTRRLDGPDTPRLRVLRNDGLGNLTEETAIEFRGNGPLSVGEVTGDSADDLVLALRGGRIQIIPGSASYDFTRLPRHRLGVRGGLSVTTGDLAGDARDEIVVATGNWVLTLRHSRDGALHELDRRPAGGTVFGSEGVYTADVDGDAQLDVVALYPFGTYFFSGKPGGRLSTAMVQASGHLSPQGELSALEGLSFADFNEDSRLDVAGVENRLRLLLQLRGRVFCKGEPVNAMGSDLVDRFIFGDHPRVVASAGKRNDVFYGTRFDDIACGGPGAEYLEGGRGADRLYGGPGADGTKRRSGAFDGGRGDDRLVGGAGDDELNGGPGRDLCDGGPGTDSYSGCEQIIDTRVLRPEE
jgi:Ca2+-binding RTX toxin-like protein